MKKWIFAFSAAISGLSQAAGTIDFLEVDNDVVLFSTTDTKTSSPACVTSEYSDLWSVSLASDSGRAIYSLILTSMAKGDGVALNIESGQNCADRNGVERAAKVNLVSTAVQNTESSGVKLGVYNGDGSKRLGTLFAIHDNGTWQYFDPAEPTGLKYLQNAGNGRTGYFFSEENCQGSVYAPLHGVSTPHYNPSYQNGQYFKSNGSVSPTQIKSQLNTVGECTATSVAAHRLNYYLQLGEPQTKEPCGSQACFLKEE